MNSTTHPNLQAPVIPVAEADGLINLSDLAQDIVMHVPVWKGSEPRDAYQLAFNGLPIGNRIEFPDPVPEGMLTLKIPLALLQVDGVYNVAYFSIGYPGGLPDSSPATTIRIDHTRLQPRISAQPRQHPDRIQLSGHGSSRQSVAARLACDPYHVSLSLFLHPFEYKSRDPKLRSGAGHLGKM